MPRSARAVTKSAASQRRTSKRSASKQPKCYDIPESPTSSASSIAKGSSRQSIETTSLPEDTASPTSSRADESGSSTLTFSSRYDATSNQPKPSHERKLSGETVDCSIPGLDALEAVNGLYQKLKDSQFEITRLREDNRKLSMQKKEDDSRIENLQTELRLEKDRLMKMQQAHGVEANLARIEVEERLHTVIASLRSYGSAALQIMPLLDVLTDATELEYDEATEKLYQIIRAHGNL